MKKIFLTCLIVQLLQEVVFAQSAPNITDQKQFELTYWNYRDRFKKFYTKIGANTGEGLPLADFVDGSYKNVANYGIGIASDFACSTGSSGVDELGDCLGTYVWEYVPVLALEYRMLRDEGKDYMPTLNELYYVLNAIDRIDRNAEQYFDNSQQPSLNGFFIRDDINASYGGNPTDNPLEGNWSNFLSKSKDSRDDVGCMNTGGQGIGGTSWDDDKKNRVINYQSDPGEPMSQDQVIGALFAMAFVKKICWDAPFVRPKTGSGEPEGMYVQTEAVNIGKRMLDFIASEKDYSYCMACSNGFNIWKLYDSWVITNPDPSYNNSPVPNGPDSKLFSYPLNQEYKYLTGAESIAPVKLGYELTLTLFKKWVFPISVVKINSSTDGLPKDAWNVIGNMMKNSWSDPALGAVASQINKLKKWQQTILEIASLGGTAELEILYNLEPVNWNWYVVNMALSMGAVDGINDHSGESNICDEDKQNSIIFDLAYSALHDDPPLLDKSKYESMLLAAPCLATNSGDPLWNMTNLWANPHRLEGLHIPSGPQPGREFNGMDYCFLYNLYRYIYRQQIANDLQVNLTEIPVLIPYEEGACPYKINPEIATATALNSPSSLTIYRRFPDYLNFQSSTPITIPSNTYMFTDGSVRINEYINNDLSINSSGDPGVIPELDIHTDMNVCYNPTTATYNSTNTSGNEFTQFSISKGGVVIIGGLEGGVDYPSTLKVQAGNKITVGGDDITSSADEAKLVIYNGDTVVIKKGATFNLLNYGVIDIQDGGTMVIEDGATFNYYDGAIINLEGTHSVLKIYGGGLHIGNNATFTYIGSGYIYYNTPWNATSFSCGTNASFVLEGSSETQLVMVNEGYKICPPDQLKLFSITNGTMQCGFNGGINCGAPITLLNFHLTKESGIPDNYVHAGINTYGQMQLAGSATTISNVEVDHGIIGIFVNALWQGAVETGLGDVEIHDCDRALISSSSGLTLYNVNLHDNANGWEAYAMSLPSECLNFQSKNNTNDGIHYMGTSSSGLDINNGDISGNGGNGIYFEGPLECTIQCSNISDNGLAGIYASGESILNLSPTSSSVNGLNGGGVSITENSENGVYFDYADYLFTGGGYNEFFSNAGGELDFAGILTDPYYCNTPLIDASNNQWTSDYSIATITNPSTANYNLSAFLCNSPTPIYMDDISPIGFNPCGSFSYHPPGPHIEPCSTCRVLSYNGASKQLNEMITDARALIFSSAETGDINAFDELYSIVNTPTPGWNSNEARFVRQAYNLIPLAYGAAVSQGQLTIPQTQQLQQELAISGDTTSEDTSNDINTQYYNRLDTLNQHILTDSVFLNDSSYLYFTNPMNLASRLTIANDYTGVATALSQIHPVNSATSNVQSHWECVNNVRAMVADNTIQKEQFLDYLDVCMSSSGGRRDNSIPINMSSSNKKELDFIIAPNPASNEIKLYINNISSDILTCEIYNMKGEKVISNTYKNIIGSMLVQSEQINSLSEGNYIVHLIDGKHEISQMLNVAR